MRRQRLYSHYDVLQVNREASRDGVRTAYRRLAQQFHPDKHPGKSAAVLVMSEINQAYEVLSDPAQRSAYDRWLEAENTRLRLAGPPTPVFTPDRFGWAGWLVFATASVALLTVGYVVVTTWWPAPALRSPEPLVQRPARVDHVQRATAAGRESPAKESP